MNATKLYTELSRKVMMLNNQVFLGEFIQNDMTLLKLRALLICRACRELCLQPYGSEYCQHLTCEECLKERTVRQACKWCRNPDDLSLDFQSKILIASYRKLCAILRDFVTGYATNSSGTTKDVKEKLLQTLDEGCELPRIEPNDEKNGLESNEKGGNAPELDNIERVSIAVQADVVPEIKDEGPVCPPCCCTCPRENGDLINREKSLNHDEKGDEIAAVVLEIKDEKKGDSVLEYRSDTVSSTVPDTIPVSFPAPDEKAQNKYGASGKDGGTASIIESHIDEIKAEPGLALGGQLSNTVIAKDENPVGSCQYLGVLPSSTISVQERENRSIFEKFGLALSPTKVENEPPKSKSAEKNRRKLKKSKEKKLKYTCEIKQKLQPLKLKVRKVNSYNEDGYSVQYNISNTNEKSEVSTFTIHKSEDCKVSDDYVTSDNLTGSDTQETESRKQKRKASLGGKYTEFSDDSDFESDSYISKIHPKVVMKKDKAEACSCGSGSHVKYFTNICKRQRCPCFSQGKSCATCKCRFCSNPFAGKTETDDMFTDSDSENEQPQLTYWLKEESEVVDVETM